MRMHLRLQLAVLLLSSFIGLAQPQTNQSPGGSGLQKSSDAEAGAVPISSEHHHHFVLGNPYVRVWEVEVPAHESTLLHQHDYDYVYLVLGDADVTNAVAGKPPVKLHLADTTVNFSKGPFAHVATTDSSVAFRNITIELLHPQGEQNKLYASLDAALGSAPGQQMNMAKGTTLLETNEIRAFAVGIAKGASWSPSSGYDHLIILPDKMRDSSGLKEANAPMFPAGMVNWIPATESWSIHNNTLPQMKVLVLEFKDSGRQGMPKGSLKGIANAFR